MRRKRDRRLAHGPLPSCPVCGTKLEYVKVVQFTAPFHCTNCQTELQVAESDDLFGACLSTAVALFVSFAIGLRGWRFALGAVLLWFPSAMVTSRVMRHTYAPKLEPLEVGRGLL